MKAHTASLINAIALIALGAWGAFGSASPTAWIPVAFGVILIALNGGLKKENKVISHIAVVITLLLLVALIMPLRGALGRGDTGAAVRVGIMLATTVLAMVYFVKSFIDARKAKG